MVNDTHPKRHVSNNRVKEAIAPCYIPDGRMGQIVGAIVLPDAWMDRVLAKFTWLTRPTGPGRSDYKPNNG